ncbi:MAG TPA: hypothetical protein VF232_13745 [Gaiellaceae bacterium]
MYDVLRSRYTFACPARGETHVTLSAFRRLVRLPGAAHPAVYEIQFTCSCGGEHVGLVADDDLDWAPLGLTAGTFLNLMTSTYDSIADELADASAQRIKAGEWPWTFFCYPEERPRPVFPSSFSLLAPGERAFGVAVSCPVCSRVSVNLVSPEHIDLPFHNDAHVGVVEHVFHADVAPTLEEFRAELYSSAFDYRRLELA